LYVTPRLVLCAAPVLLAPRKPVRFFHQSFSLTFISWRVNLFPPFFSPLKSGPSVTAGDFPNRGLEHPPLSSSKGCCTTRLGRRFFFPLGFPVLLAESTHTWASRPPPPPPYLSFRALTPFFRDFPLRFPHIYRFCYEFIGLLCPLSVRVFFPLWIPPDFCTPSARLQECVSLNFQFPIMARCPASDARPRSRLPESALPAFPVPLNIQYSQ